MDENQERERRWRMTQNLTFLFPLLLCILVVYSVFGGPISPSRQSLSLKDASAVLRELGYSPYDSTNTLCVRWINEPYQVSSISVESDGLRLDLYQSDNSLPIHGLEGILESYMSNRIPRYPYQGECDGRNFKAYLYKSEECAVMQIRLDDTMLFIEWDPDCEDRVLEILDALGYPGEKAMKDLRNVIWR